MVGTTPYLNLGISLPRANLSVTAGPPLSFNAGKELLQLFQGFVHFPVLSGAGWSDLTQAMGTLTPRHRNGLIEKFGRAAFVALSALAGETDPVYFFQGLLELGKGLVDSGRETAAWNIFKLCESSAPTAELAASAGESRRQLEGEGNFGAKAEHFLRVFSREAADLKNLVPTLGASFFGSMSYNIIRWRFARMLSVYAEDFPLDILRLRFKSRVFALLWGGAVATVADQGLRSFAGDAETWTADSMGQSYRNSLVNLFAWRLSLGLSGLVPLKGPGGQPLRNKLEAFLFTQAAATTGLAYANTLNSREQPRSQEQFAAQLFHTLLGMNLGRWVGKRAVVRMGG